MKSEKIMAENRKELQLGEKPVGRLLWNMAVPSMIGVMAYNLYNIFDTLFLSWAVGADAVGGVSVSLPVFLFLSAVSTTLGSGGAVCLSRALGENNIEKANKTAANTFVVFYSVAVLVTVLGLLYLEKMLYAMGITEDLLPYAREYSRIILAGAVTSTGFSSLIRAEGSSRYAMFIWVIPMGTNIVLDYLFLFWFHWGVSGAAAATVLAQMISMGMSIYYFFLSGKSVVKLLPRHFIPDRMLMKEIISIGIPSFVQTAGMSISVIMTNRFLKSFGGTLPISTYGIVSRIYSFFQIPLLGLSQGLQPVISYNHGANKHNRVQEAVRLSSLAAVGYGLLVWLLTICFAQTLMCLFTKEIPVVILGGHALTIISAGILFSGLQNVQATYFQAVGKKGAALLVALCNYVFCFFPALYILTKYVQLDGVWWSLPVSSAVTVGLTGVLQSVCMGIRKKRCEKE